MKVQYSLDVLQKPDCTTFRFLFAVPPTLVPVTVYAEKVENEAIMECLQSWLVDEAIVYANGVLRQYGLGLVADEIEEE